MERFYLKNKISMRNFFIIISQIAIQIERSDGQAIRPRTDIVRVFQML